MINQSFSYPYELKRDYPTYSIYRNHACNTPDYMIFIKANKRYYGLSFVSIKSAIDHMEKRIQEGRV
jgi:hypothetical protein